ncbi:uncharacterized protein LOC128860410 isoform X2 [Anastrepha ludens]|uniref:uncharacterized protein LOC128860410 isoform X2 n=1 Tax=Anastrepha ludens TaxID=28586 RepID=UPI0023B04A09|nr:uncharacterized protein LOC128860410 isoform X2 [Anastrepha ludens]
MADARGQYQKLPPGWDCKYDQATGNCYYVNYFTKAMQLEDPRARYKQLQNERCSTESIAMQPVHGSPYHVYPSNNLPAMRAFQAGPGTNTSLHNMSSSPLLSSRGNLEISPLPLPRSLLTQTPRLSNMSRRSTIQETSFTNPIDTDAVVNKIQNMFPTASEDHIRLLLKKYMKTIFPKADEMVLLDILASSDNNVQTASEKLISMGYTKRDFIPPKTTHRFDAAKKPGNETIIPLRPKEYTTEEKATIHAQLKEKYPQIAERIILMALESVNYAEDRAVQILHIVQEEDELQAKKHSAEAAAFTTADAAGEPELVLGTSEMRALVDDGVAEDGALQQASADDGANFKQRQEFKSIIGRIATTGHCADLAKGADESLLLADYVTWNGANPDMPQGNNQRQLVHGPDVGKLNECKYKAVGRNTELCKGAQKGLAKGSIYAQLAATGNTNTANIKCN